MRNALSTIYFDYDKSDLKSEAISALESAASVLNQYPTVRVMAEGHADERGTDEYNMGLGEARANSTKDYLTSYGIEADRLEITSYGKERPANPNCDGDEDCHSLNRRVEWRILD
ncbi:MAG: OmpA family protein [Chitinispirillaceae bacterium]